LAWRHRKLKAKEQQQQKQEQEKLHPHAVNRREINKKGYVKAKNQQTYVK
jgi:hypothetical protein